MPITGMFTACAGVVDHAQGDGLDGGAGKSGSDLAMRGLRVSASMRMATKVLTSDRASAPASCEMWAICAMLVTLGESFYDQRASRNPFRGGHHFVQGARIAAELQATVGGVGAGNVQLVGGDAIAIV